jgi:[acyl-carrier-protein] S-malonyltransferase
MCEEGLDPAPRPLAMFPGQGSQRPGMARELLAAYPAAAGAVFDTADRVLGMPLAELCVSGSAEQLRRTEVTQPAVLATSVAAWTVLRAGGFEPAAVAGHSLGEYTALVAAGVLTFESALLLVRRRGQLMADVGRRTPGAMAAIVGLPPDTVERLCAAVRGTGVVEVANYNEPGQTVVSGHRAAVRQLARRAEDAGARRVVQLDVGAPFHCSLMQPVQDVLGAELDRQEFRTARLPVVSAMTGDYLGDDVRGELRRQLTSPVRWVDTLRRAHAAGHDLLVEVGPGRTLSGLARQTVPELPVYSTSRPAGITAALAASRHPGRAGPTAVAGAPAAGSTSDHSPRTAAEPRRTA